MRHHIGTVANVNAPKTINGKKLILILGVGSVLFTAVMGYGTFFLAKFMTPFLQKHSAPVSQSKSAPIDK